jgi:KipI family sensor histidine kinase inhibitor
LSTEEVIKRHQAIEYRVYAIGFAPGFAYLGDLDPALALPRLSSPREQVAAGSLAIAEQQTAIYPAPSPGGWHIIGRCPTRLFDASQTPPMPFGVGDRIRFHPVRRHEFEQLGGIT